MSGSERKFRAMVSSDWSECLSPNGPFDPIAFNYPALASDLHSIFARYTGNLISLTEATRTILDLIPGPFTEAQMDAYLDASFQTYPGVPDLIEWCLSRHILFMIDTTGTQGYFQRALHKGLLPPALVIAANPMIRFGDPGADPRFAHEILEIDDKPKCTRAVMVGLDLEPKNLVVIGDSGGDGPHFQWAGAQGAFLIGSMTKPSLENQCRSGGITIHRRFGISYGPGEKRDLEKEMKVNFMELADVIGTAVELSANRRER